jgi:CRP/FNR family cyclic AMP-dependent transcriptional regulator
MPASAAAAEETGMLTLSSEILIALTNLGHTASPLRLARGDLISLEDGRGRGVHVLSRGRMKILRFSDEGRVILLELIEPGGVFGELSFAPEPRDDCGSNYAEALEDSIVYTIPFLTFERVLRQRPTLAVGIASLLGQRCNKLERRLEAHVFHRVPTRLANQLLELATRYGEAHADGTLLCVPLSQQDLGNLIGASREIVSLTLSDFKRRGLVSSKGRRLVVRESALREELAQAPV